MSIKVKDEYRKNELSFSPGGSDVTVIHKNGKMLTYDKIKNIERYCTILKNDQTVIEIKVNGQDYWKKQL
jgi:hypothetical protein